MLSQKASLLHVSLKACMLTLKLDRSHRRVQIHNFYRFLSFLMVGGDLLLGAGRVLKFYNLI